MGIDWSKELSEQLDWHWTQHLRPRLNTLTDDEYLWEPVEGCWTIRASKTGEIQIDWAYPEPSPPPVTTIAWRLAHIIVGVFAMRNASHFGGPPVDYQTFPYAASAKEALKQLDDAYAHWRDSVRRLSAEDLARPCGPAEGPYSEYPLATLVLHINREVIHHGAEILLLRDLYRRRV
ncbi:DinB family protein [Amycolatopsis regifaucium]|uniref:Serine/arginine repetitive matrix protein 1 n=1 Tax=Amycolatopsis regifaucium TaxID=546365 RepID=A0A154MC39_9PSEU|nr:DinB family protein [Amycolatopsis regifaucium]KZB82135.1 serine/arginine repetitive matrix protein 1 [Amycolatopsis regifaucium]OKA05795.1 serine/arginine repetitive matrix protein 1 [Amycolatopsis regifaucium]SFG83651.1 DinB superfamily protein [Amycolatopsis regifaucium]